MSKPRPLQNIQQADLVTIGELAVLSKMRYSTLKYYTEIGILPFHQEGEKLNRRYDRISSLKRLEEINKLKAEKRLTIKELVEHFG